GGLPFTVGTVVAQFGQPCLVHIDLANLAVSMTDLIYPTMTLTVGDLDGPRALRLRQDSPVWLFAITYPEKDSYNDCSRSRDERLGYWYGFASAKTYYRRNLAAIGKPYPPVDDE